MTNAIRSRVGKLENRIPGPEKERRVFTAVCSEDTEAEAYELLKAHGYDDSPGSDDFVIMWKIVSAKGGESKPVKPYFTDQGEAAA